MRRDAAAPDRILADKPAPDKKQADVKPALDKKQADVKPPGDVWPAVLPCNSASAIEVGGTRHWNASVGALVVCGDKSTAVSQQAAPALCGGGWTLCTPAKYRAHFPFPGTAPAGQFHNAWLAACVRNSGVAYYATSICPALTCNMGAVDTVASACSSSSPGPFATSHLTVGLVSAATCIVFGPPADAGVVKTEGWWALRDTCNIMSAPLANRALCCYP